MRSLRRRLSFPYRRLKNISNPNGAYIDTGIYGSPDLDFSLDIALLPQKTFVFCTRYRKGTREIMNAYAFLGDSVKTVRFDNGNVLNNIYNVDYSGHLSVVKQGNTISINGKEYMITLGSGNTQKPIIVFGSLNTYDNSVIYNDVTIERLRFSKNGVVLRDFMPYVRKRDGKIGMYDNIERKFYISPNGVDFTGE